MKSSYVNICLIDDEFPKPDYLRKAGVFNKGIEAEVLYKIAFEEEWSSNLRYLQELIKEIAFSESKKKKNIDLTGFSSPSQALIAINNGYSPDIVIYDWEYQNAPITNQNSKEWLLEILNRTSAFIFIYSRVRDEIPRFLNREEFDPYSKRFKLFLKGDIFNSVFSSEEYIFQDILTRSSNADSIKMQGKSIEFLDNKYLENPEDILYLEKIFGRAYLLKKLDEGLREISDQTIEEMVGSLALTFQLNEESRKLYTEDFNLSSSLGKRTEILSAIEVLKRFGISKLRGVLEDGIIKI